VPFSTGLSLKSFEIWDVRGGDGYNRSLRVKRKEKKKCPFPGFSSGPEVINEILFTDVSRSSRLTLPRSSRENGQKFISRRAPQKLWTWSITPEKKAHYFPISKIGVVKGVFP